MDTYKSIKQAVLAVILLLASATLVFAARSEGVGTVDDVAVESGTISIDNNNYLIKSDVTRLTIGGYDLRLDKLATDLKVYFQVSEKEKYRFNYKGPKTLSEIRLLGPQQAINQMFQD
jgi:hypothetical protein